MADTITSDDVVERFPEFAGREDEIDALLPEAAQIIGEDWVDADINPAKMYWIAHKLATGGDNADRGNIASESFGPISVSYGSGGQNSSEYASTSYGRMYLSIQKRNFLGPVVV